MFDWLHIKPKVKISKSYGYFYSTDEQCIAMTSDIIDQYNISSKMWAAGRRRPILQANSNPTGDHMPDSSSGSLFQTSSQQLVLYHYYIIVIITSLLYIYYFINIITIISSLSYYHAQIKWMKGISCISWRKIGRLVGFSLCLWAVMIILVCYLYWAHNSS